MRFGGKVLRLAFACALATAAATPAGAQTTILDEWSNAKAPPLPVAQKVTLDLKTTALLMLDFTAQSCGSQPRCVASIPAARRLLDAARAKGMFVVYSLGPTSAPSDVRPELAPLGSEPIVKSSADKFYNTNLDAILKGKGIKTVIDIGTVANGAVLFTGSEAVMRGYDVVVPVEGISAATLYAEQFSVWQLSSRGAKITRGDMVSF